MRTLRVVFILAFALLFINVIAADNAVICPIHGVRSIPTGNKKVAGKTWYCEYSHPLDTGGVHKFWFTCQ